MLEYVYLRNCEGIVVNTSELSMKTRLVAAATSGAVVIAGVGANRILTDEEQFATEVTTPQPVQIGAPYPLVLPVEYPRVIEAPEPPRARTHVPSQVFVGFRERGIKASTDTLETSKQVDRFIDIDGFKVRVDTEKVRENLGPRDVVLVTLRDRSPVNVANTGYPDDSENNIAITGGNYTYLEKAAEIGRQQELVQKIEAALPSHDRFNEDEPVLPDTVSFSRELDDIPPEGVSIRFDTYRFKDDGSIQRLGRLAGSLQHSPNVKCKYKDVAEDIVSEVQLKKRQKQAVCDMLKKYGRFVPDDYRIILDSVPHQSQAEDHHTLQTRVIQLTYPYSGDQTINSKTGLMPTALHETLHATWRNLPADERIVRDSYAVYSRIKAYDPGRKSPVWTTLKEGTYMPQRPRAGHPWDNPTEMISSTARVMAYFPDELLESYAQLTPKEQELVRDAARVSQEVVASEYPDVSQIILDSKRINKALKLS